MVEKKFLSSNLGLIYKLFPFHFAMNARLNITHMGKGLAKLLDWNGQAQPFARIFNSDLPLCEGFEKIIQYQDKQITLKIDTLNLELKGQFLCLHEIPDSLLFIGSLIFNPHREMGEFNLDLSDFALYDISPNLLFVLEAQKNSIQEVSQLAQKLRAQADHLKRVNEELEEYAYVVSHDLQTPLRSIVGFAQLLQRSSAMKLDANGSEYLSYIIDSAKRMHSLTRDLLNYSSLQNSELKFEPVNLNLLVAETLIDLSVFQNEMGGSLHIDTLPVVQADKKGLRRVFQNLLHNAFKFRSERPLEVRLSVEDRPHCWYFEIRDNGIGMEEKYLARIFKVFQKLHLSQEYEGNGIGLAICKKIIQQHQGEIGATSVVGEGTCFYFTIAKGLT